MIRYRLAVSLRGAYGCWAVVLHGVLRESVSIRVDWCAFELVAD